MGESALVPPATQTASSTLRNTDEERLATHAADACLVFSLQCDNVAEPPRVVELRSVSRVKLGRGSSFSVSLTSESGAAALWLQLADQRVSTMHAKLDRLGDGWHLIDAGSKNGTLVNGVHVGSQRLSDGDVVEIGGTFLVFRERGRGHVVDEQLPAMRTLHDGLASAFEAVRTIAGTTTPVLIRGPVGSGKEVTARAVHALSKRPGPLVAINCGALPSSLLESELFGTRRGAFSGAEDRPGLIKTAHRGTLFLDEIAELPAVSQAALLRVLQEREVLALGDTRPQPVDVRVVAATHQDLRARAFAGEFRDDLLSRLCGFELELPPLRERREDLGLLIAALLGDARNRVALSRSAARALFTYAWPHNIRELGQTLETATALAGKGGTIELSHLPPRIQHALEPAAQSSTTAASQDGGGSADEEKRLRDRLEHLLVVHGGNVSAVAREMGEHRTQVRRWLDRLGLAVGQYRKRTP